MVELNEKDPAKNRAWKAYAAPGHTRAGSAENSSHLGVNFRKQHPPEKEQHEVVEEHKDDLADKGTAVLHG